MGRFLSRLVALAILAGGLGLGVRWWRGRNAEAPSATPGSWPPFEPPAPHPQTQPFAAEASTQPAGASWVLPVDGECPAGYPIKANDDSGIYHSPGGRSYERTVAERCYATTDDAERDGYRAAKA